MAKKYLDDNGLLYFWQKIKSIFVADVTFDPHTSKIQKTKADSTTDVVTLSTVATSGSYNDLSNKPTIPSGVEKSTTTPLMDGTASVGSEVKFAAGDHVHPTDTSRAASSHTHGNITNAGALQTTDIAIANGDKLVVTDSSNSNKVARTSASFDGSTTTKYLSKKGTFEDVPTIPNSFGKVKVGSTTIESDTTQDTLELEAGTNISLTPDATNDKVTIGFSGTIPTVPNNFGTVKVGSTNVVADTTSDTLELVAGSNVTLTPDATNDKVTIAATDTTYSDFIGSTSSSAGIHGLVPAPPSGGISLLTSKADWRHLLFTNENSSSILHTTILDTGSITFELYNASSTRTGLMPSTDKAKLDSITITDGIIDPSNLPSYVDDVIEAYPRSGQTELSSTWLSKTSGGSALTPETGKIYVLMADSTSYAANTQFRWSGSAYVKLADGGVSEITNAEIDTIVAS